MVSQMGFYYRDFTCVKGSDGAWHWGFQDWNYSAGSTDDFVAWVDHVTDTRRPETISIPAVWRKKEEKRWLLDRGIHRERA